MAVAELVVKLIGDISAFQKSMKEAGHDVKRTGNDLKQSGAMLTKAISLPLAAIGGASLKMAGDFQSAMSKVSALGDIFGDDLKKLEDQALSLGATTQFSAQEVAEGMGEYAAAGFKANEISAAMKGTLDLAAAGQLSVARASEITSATLRQFNLDASESTRVANVLASGAAKGSTSVDDLGEAMKYAGTTAPMTGQSFEDLVGALTLLSNNMIKAGDAGTDLNAGFANLLKPTKLMRGALESMGLTIDEFKTADGKLIPLIDIIEKLNAAGIKGEQVYTLFGKENAKSWSVMLDKGAPALQALTKEIKEDTNAADKMATILRDNLGGSFEEMMGAVETLGIAFGSILIPAARAVMGVIQKTAEAGVNLAKWFKDLPKPIQNAAIAFTGFVAIVGPLVFTVGALVNVIGTMMVKLGGAKSILALIAGPAGILGIGLALGVVVGLMAAFPEETEAAFSAVSRIIQESVNIIVDIFAGILNAGADVFEKIILIAAESMNIVATAIEDAINFVADLVLNWDQYWQDAMEVVVALVDSGCQQIAELFGVNFETVKEIVYSAFEAIASYANNTLLPPFEIVLNVLVGLFRETGEIIKEVFIAAFDLIIESLGVVQDGVSLFSDSAAQGIGSMKQALESLKQPAKEVKISIDDIKKSTSQYSTVIEGTGDELKKLKEAHDKETESTKKSTKATEEKGRATEESTKKTKKKTEAEREAERQAKALEKAEEDHRKKVDDLVTSSSQYEQALKDIQDASIPASVSAGKLKDLYVKADIALKNYNEANEIYQDALKRMNAGENIAAEQFKEIVAAVDTAQKAVKDFDPTPKGKGKSADGSEKGLADFANDLLGFDLSTGDAELDAMFDNVAGQIYDGIGKALSSEATLHSQDYGKLVGQTVTDGLAAAADSYLPGSGQIVQMFGPIITDGIAGLFGSDSAAEKARKTADKFFADMFEENRLAVIINGKLTEIKDLVFQGDSLFGGENFQFGAGMTSFLETLPADAQASFSGVGLAFEELLGVGEDISGQIAVALANNIGGSLNNLQLLVGSTGKSFKELEEVVVKAFLNGKVSALQAQTALNGLAQVAQKGIPDGIGYTVQAFENLKAAGIKGGAVSVDALQDIGFEAKELGISTFPALIANLQASGKYTAEEIQQVFSALSSHGIDSVQKLTEATDRQLLGVLAQLEAQEFPFARAMDDAKEFADVLEGMPSKKDITIDVKTNFDGNTKEAIDAGIISSRSSGNPIIRAGVTQSAKGNIFKGGSVMPFFKGGVVPNFTAFDIGTMAERGPEAIMPLKRMSGGDLGVRVETSGPQNHVTNVTINAPYASPGVAEQIRREVEKMIDTKNNKLGIR